MSSNALKKIISKLSETAQNKLIKTPQPKWIIPMAAILSATQFPVKIIFMSASGTGNVLLRMTRNQKIANNAYPAIVQALQKQ